MDGNGRTARFVMNSQLVTAGYPWVVIPVERREEYMAALEQASVEGDVEGFVRLLRGVMRGKSSLIDFAVIQKRECENFCQIRSFFTKIIFIFRLYQYFYYFCGGNIIRIL